MSESVVLDLVSYWGFQIYGWRGSPWPTLPLHRNLPDPIRYFAASINHLSKKCSSQLRARMPVLAQKRATLRFRGLGKVLALALLIAPQKMFCNKRLTSSAEV